ncbi:hypothetical protein DYQ86_13655 [Acidobacteria bacterium AB60]|nr:hypothetical protein DYQ86_13655 [Acidobacteria bacterium AB60]
MGFIAFFALLWCFASIWVSWLGGWILLARRFRKETEPCGDLRIAGPWFHTVTLRFLTRYNSVVRVVAANDALYLSVLALFRIGHPPLRIPWDEVSAQRIQGVFRRYVELRLGRQEQIPMRISEGMASQLQIQDRLLTLS